MASEPLRLTASVLAAYRPGACVAVAMGSILHLPRRRPTPYAVAGRGMRARGYGLGSERGASAPPPASETAIIPMRGVLETRATDRDSDCGHTESCGYDTIAADILGALADPGVGQGLLDIDSCGGDVEGLEETAIRVRAGVVELGKPLIGLVNEKCFSAAAWFAWMVCDGIFLPRRARIGSVGAYVAFESDAGALLKAGRSVYVGRRPAGKGKPHSDEALDDIGKARIDRLADEGASAFFEAVETYRGIPAATAESWNGDTFTGQLAVDAGLADGIGSMDEVIALAESWPRAAKAA